MTRVNLVDPASLTRNHLIAEYRELPRVFARVRDAEKKGMSPSNFAARTPSSFTLGTGHMLFFYTRLGWLCRRYAALVAEMQRRGFDVQYPEPPEYVSRLSPWWFGEWEPSPEEIEISRVRIAHRLTQRMTYKHRPAPKTGATGFFRSRV
jgi:deoxyribonuclease (pyrimidine dimer)